MRLGLDILFNGLQSIILVENVARGRYGGQSFTEGLGFRSGVQGRTFKRTSIRKSLPSITLNSYSISLRHGSLLPASSCAKSCKF